MTSSPADIARSLAAQGRSAEAIAALTAAGDRGDVDALMQQAMWHLGGTVLPRDLDAARALMRRAVAIGHVDGALMEIAMTANGNGNGNAVAPDWPGARHLLDIAAAGDPVAQQQLALLARMKLGSDGAPADVPEGNILSDAPRVIHFPALLTPEECAHVATVASELLEPAHVIDPRTGRQIPHPVRTSDGAAIGPMREDMVVRAINLRIAAISGTHVAQGEPLTVLRYRPGQQYRPHLDTIDGAANQRIRTVLVYLNQGFGGGETSFPLLPLTIRPRGGDAIVFDTTLPDGRPDPRMRHAGEPVTAGIKWLATRWIRESPVDPWTLRGG